MESASTVRLGHWLRGSRVVPPMQRICGTTIRSAAYPLSLASARWSPSMRWTSCSQAARSERDWSSGCRLARSLARSKAFLALAAAVARSCRVSGVTGVSWGSLVDKTSALEASTHDRRLRRRIGGSHLRVPSALIQRFLRFLIEARILLGKGQISEYLRFELVECHQTSKVRWPLLDVLLFVRQLGAKIDRIFDRTLGSLLIA